MKLFKKAMAAVLAGVMALSMVACAPVAPVDPEKPVDPTLTEEQQFFQMINNKVEKLDFLTNFGKKDEEKIAFPVFENNAELKAEAEKILDAIAAGTPTHSTADGTIVSYKAKAGTTKGTITVLSGASVEFDSNTAKTYKINADVNQLEYKATVAQGWVDSGFGATAEASAWLAPVKVQIGTGAVTTVSYKAAYNFGFATKVINGQTCVVVVSKAA